MQGGNIQTIYPTKSTLEHGLPKGTIADFLETAAPTMVSKLGRKEKAQLTNRHRVRHFRKQTPQ